MSKNTHAELRRGARISAVQALYQMDVGKAQIDTVIGEFLNHRIGTADGAVMADEDFFEELIKGVVREQDRVDTAISEHLSAKWSLRRLDLTLRAIMRAAAFEITQRPDVPALVIIDQYVSITADFYDGKEPNFVNAALDSLAKKVRAAEFGITGPAACNE